MLKSFLLFGLLLSSQLFAMGGDKLGPHRGYITMPATYHLEIVDNGEILKVYLLDIGMKNPTTIDSTVSINLVAPNKKLELKCKAEKVFFNCNNPAKSLDSYSTIEVNSMRKKVKGQVASYQIPLKLDK